MDHTAFKLVKLDIRRSLGPRSFRFRFEGLGFRIKGLPYLADRRTLASLGFLYWVSIIQFERCNPPVIGEEWITFAFLGYVSLTAVCTYVCFRNGQDHKSQD